MLEKVITKQMPIWVVGRGSPMGYSRINSGLKSHSGRVVLNGGLSPLRNECDHLKMGKQGINLLSSGNGLARASNKLGFKPYPPKNWTFARRLSSHNMNGGSRPISSNPNGGIQQFLSSENSGLTVHRSAFLYRNQFNHAKRVVIKLGSAVITREDGNGLALGRLASIVEQVAELQNDGHECILITSGAVAYGKQKLAQEMMMSMSMRETLHQKTNTREDIKTFMQSGLKKPNAAVGQSGLQALYETMFRNYGLLVGQVLVTKPDFYNDFTRHQLFTTIDELLQLNIIPIINTNDAVSPPMQKDDEHQKLEPLGIKDNDSLAARVAAETNADLAILMSDVDGIYDKPPGSAGGGDAPRVIHTFNPEDLKRVRFGAKSDAGTGGMESKVQSALWALEKGVSVVICNGMKYNSIRKVMSGEKIGSFFTKAETDAVPVEVLAKNARNGSRRLQSLSAGERATIIRNIANSMVERVDEILEANQKDLYQAQTDGITGPMYSRLAITKEKIDSLAVGLQQIADASLNNVGRVLRQTEVSETLALVQKTVPIGVLMVIFESRPDALPQVASLAIATANGLMLKGGKEATKTNEVLNKIVREALGVYGCADAIAMVSSREAIGDLLKMDQYIDLVIPRGSSSLVASIKEQSKMIPVLGHAEGVCHVFVDKDADAEKAVKIVLDAKTDYPAACNAMETMLLHRDLLKSELFDKICQALKSHGVKIFSGPHLFRELNFGPPLASSLHCEYGDLACTIEIVDSMEDAIDHIHKFGSGHTDVIVTENKVAAQAFLDKVDSACVFANASSRMADGYRLGLGAEVGISTGRIHARGPVGVEGLLTTKWILEGVDDTAGEYTSGKKKFIHRQMRISNMPDEPEVVRRVEKDDDDVHVSY